MLQINLINGGWGGGERAKEEHERARESQEIERRGGKNRMVHICKKERQESENGVEGH